MDIITFFKTHWEDILAIYGSIVGLCTAIVKFTPSTKDDTIWGNIIKVLDFFSTAFTDSDKERLNK